MREKAEGKGVKVIIVVLRIIIHQLAGKDFGEVKLSFLGDDGKCPSSVVDRNNLEMRYIYLAQYCVGCRV